MFKKLSNAAMGLIIAAILVVAAASAVPAQAAPAQATTGALSAAEAASLKFMVEEEKLARDVYLALYEKWGLPVFQNISSSEQTHMNTVGQLIVRYGLTSPVQSAPGKFTDPALQSLYTQLVARGSASIGEALKVGGLIEETDIRDLQSRIQETTRADIQQVYNNLMQGSYNHLRAFSSTLKTQTGETYQPQKLNLTDYQAITSNSRDGFGRQNGRGRRAGS